MTLTSFVAVGRNPAQAGLKVSPQVEVFPSGWKADAGRTRGRMGRDG